MMNEDPILWHLCDAIDHVGYLDQQQHLLKLALEQLGQFPPHPELNDRLQCLIQNYVTVAESTLEDLQWRLRSARASLAGEIENE